MSATTIFVIAIIGAGVLTVLGIFAIAIRRGPSAGPITSDEIEGKPQPAVHKAPVVHVGADDADAGTVAVAQSPKPRQGLRSIRSPTRRRSPRPNTA